MDAFSTGQRFHFIGKYQFGHEAIRLKSLASKLTSVEQSTALNVLLFKVDIAFRTFIWTPVGPETLDVHCVFRDLESLVKTPPSPGRSISSVDLQLPING